MVSRNVSRTTMVSRNRNDTSYPLSKALCAMLSARRKRMPNERMLRKLNLPNTSYGEDYALGLQISREYRIGRIYDVLYCCRRWDGNSDAALDIEKVNANNLYKDRIRTWELEARIRMNRR